MNWKRTRNNSGVVCATMESERNEMHGHWRPTTHVLPAEQLERARVCACRSLRTKQFRILFPVRQWADEDTLSLCSTISASLFRFFCNSSFQLRRHTISTGIQHKLFINDKMMGPVEERFAVVIDSVRCSKSKRVWERLSGIYRQSSVGVNESVFHSEQRSTHTRPQKTWSRCRCPPRDFQLQTWQPRAMATANAEYLRPFGGASVCGSAKLMMGQHVKRISRSERS